MRQQKKNVGILVHGCFLQATEWERIVWGEPPYLLGRIAKAVLTAYEENAQVVVFGTGASQLTDGTKEGQATVNYMFEHFDELSKFKVFDVVDLARLKKKMEKISIAEVRSKNTKEEVYYAGEIFLSRDVDKVISISSPTHASRCFLNAYQIFSSEHKFASLKGGLSAQMSDTCFANSTPEDVTIFEPPHRKDRSKFPIHRQAQRIFKISPKLMSEFGRKFASLVQKYVDMSDRSKK